MIRRRIGDRGVYCVQPFIAFIALKETPRVWGDLTEARGQRASAARDIGKSVFFLKEAKLKIRGKRTSTTKQ